MKCDNARHYWHRHLDDGATDAELDGHLASCESCRKYAANMVRLVGLFDELHEDTESLTPAATPFGHGTSRRQHGWGIQTPILLRIAATILIVVGAALWFRTPKGSMVVSPTTEAAAPAPQGITLRAESRGRFIAVAAPSDEPNIQTFWLYPMVAVAESRDRS